MSNLIYKSKTDGATYEFKPDGSIVQTKASATSTGQWTGVADPQAPTGSRNALRFTLDQKTWQTVAVQYAFVTDASKKLQNVLQATIAAASNSDNAASSGQYPGHMSAGDAHDITVDIYNNDKEGKTRIIVYGALSLPAPFTTLSVSLEGGGTGSISGSVNAVPSGGSDPTQPGPTLSDLLEFVASTNYPSSANPSNTIVVESDINFLGAWNLQNNSLIFSGSADISNGRISPNFIFATKLGATELGLEVHTDTAGTSVAFVVAGTMGTPDGLQGNWYLEIGYSGHQAVITFGEDVKSSKVGDDSELTFKGSATLSSNSSAIAVNLNLTYTAKVVRKSSF